MKNPDAFFSHIRRALCSGRMTSSQVAGFNALLSASEGLETRQRAYTFATAFHETRARMQPVREGDVKTDKAARAAVNRLAAERGPDSAVAKYAKPDPVTGEVYYGRGLSQLTWADNYKKMGAFLGLPLYEKPDLALEPDISSRILIAGMVRGSFTGRALRHYFNAGSDNPVGARKIINGTDKAGLIAGYYHEFVAAFAAGDADAAEAAPEPDTLERETPTPRYAEDVKPLHQSKSIIGGGIATAGTAVGAVVDELKPEDVPISQDALDAVQASQDALAYGMGVWEWAGVAAMILAFVGLGMVFYSKYKRRKAGID